MMTRFSVELGDQAARRWFGLLFLAVAFFAFEPVEKAINAPLAAAWSLPMMVGGEMSMPHYAVLMVVRLLLDLLIVAGVFIILGQRWIAFPLTRFSERPAAAIPIRGTFSTSCRPARNGSPGARSDQKEACSPLSPCWLRSACWSPQRQGGWKAGTLMIAPAPEFA